MNKQEIWLYLILLRGYGSFNIKGPIKLQSLFLAMRVYCFVLVIIGIWFPSALIAQQDPEGKDAEAYQIYSVQVAELLKVRGMDDKAIAEILSVYKENDISSDDKLASLLLKLYPDNQGILFIFYQFYNDTLRRVVLEPGKVKEKIYIPVTRKEILQLGTDFNHLLGLYSSSDSRMPSLRGAIVKPPPATAGLTYQKLIQKATTLLLPAWFDQSWKHLVIIPALNLGTLPFYLLSPYPDQSILLDHCSYSVAPTIGDLIALRLKMLKLFLGWNGNIRIPFNKIPESGQMDSAAFKLENPLFISNPVYPLHTAYSFPDLPGAGKEIDLAIPFAQNYVLLKGAAAQKDSVLKYIENADLVYFATHGMASDEDPKNKCFLVLSGQDPFFTAKNIMDCRNRFRKFPEMVILSACQTGLGKSMEAGVAGLARSFMLAGAHHIIMSLWNVDDEATAFLMNRFIIHLQEPHRFMPSEPLRQALIDTRAKFPKSSQWASFAAFGVDF